jgi:RNA polymerase sigma-70 factor (ECF subfamily)
VALYDQLYALQPNQVVAVNRAVAVAALEGPGAGLAALDVLDAERLESYQPYHATRADLLARAGRPADAVAAYDRALALTTNPVERRFLAEQRDRAATDAP